MRGVDKISQRLFDFWNDVFNAFGGKNVLSDLALKDSFLNSSLKTAKQISPKIILKMSQEYKRCQRSVTYYLNGS